MCGSVTMVVLAALLVPLLLFIPWADKWIPALVVIPVGIADSYGMFWVVSVVRKFMEDRTSNLNRGRNRVVPDDGNRTSPDFELLPKSSTIH